MTWWAGLFAGLGIGFGLTTWLEDFQRGISAALHRADSVAQAEAEMTTEDCLDCVKAAIGRYDRAKAEWLRLEMDPTSSAADRNAARNRTQFSEREFGWQLENVRAILKEANL